MTTEIESIIDQGVNAQIRGLAVQAILNKAGDIPLAKLAELQTSDRYGPVMEQVTLQELIDAYVEQHGLAPGVDDDKPKARVVATKGKAKKKKSTSGSKARSKGKGGGGGSAAPGRKVNFRDADAKAAYAEAVRGEIQARGGQPISTTELTDICGGSSNQVRDILLSLVEDGEVVCTGQARATRYYWRTGASAEVIAKFEAEVPQAATG
jgi:hypothetical protein